MGPIRSVLIVAGVAAALAGGAWYVFKSVSYGPLEERTGQVIRAEYVPAHDVERWERDDRYHRRPPQVDHVSASWLVVIAWEEGNYESRSESLYSQVQVGSEVTLHVRQRFWRSKPSGWSVQTVSPR